MKKSQTRSLLALNGVLLLVLGFVAVMPEASASSNQPARARGDYTMVAGGLNFGNSSAIWIVDANNEELIVLRWNSGRRNFEGIGYRNIPQDARAQPGR